MTPYHSQKQTGTKFQLYNRVETKTLRSEVPMPLGPLHAAAPPWVQR